MKGKRRENMRAEKYQAAYFGYPSLGPLAWLMPVKAIRWYCMKRFYEQDEGAQAHFVKMLETNKRRRERFIKKAAGR